MLPNEPQTKLKRYRFNSKRQKHNNQQAVICVWISGLVIIVFLILGGIKLVNHHQSAQPVLHSHVSRHISKSDRSSQRMNKHSARMTTGENNGSPANSTTENDHRKQPVPSQPVYHKQRFASVNNAKDWARATQQRWLHQGYSDYVVRSDGQGNYYLQFTR